ncbi:hypothetical protein AGDE_15729 [Angomonas deanei]|nr:hypothetical protein AGDE_15729 [Angomonas deanei]|eukprot:EPY18566.1 hypothetical protein AGDE_15729 [Angomonas deanei]
MAIGASAGTFFVAGSTPFPVYVSKEMPSPNGMNSPGAMEPTASMKPYMIQDVVRGGSLVQRKPSVMEDVFFAEHPNVADMQSQPTEVIAAEVWRLRHFVQLISQSKQRQKDSDDLYEKFGVALQTTMPDAYKHRSHRESYFEDRRQSDVEDAERLVQPRDGTFSASYKRYSDRRRQLVREIVKELDPNTFAAVYSYYRDNSVVRRDPAVIMSWVPRRESWTVLPLVEQVLVLDRFMSRPNV